MKRYPGLSPFTIDQKDLFFGRDNDIKELSKLIFIERKVLLYSKSGYGKTSLLNAGVIPYLKKENPNFEFISIRFTSYNKENTENKFSPNAIFLQNISKHTDFEKTADKQTFLDTFAQKYSHTHWFKFKKNQLAGNKHKNYILVFDQFEELFSYPKPQIEEFYHSFADLIKTGRQPLFVNEFKSDILKNKKQIDETQLELFYDDINVQCVFSMRSDRLSELNKLADKISDIQKVFYELKPLNAEQARFAIKEPAQREGDFESPKFTFTEAAIDKILKFLTNNYKQSIESTQLQIVCQRIEERGDDDGIITDLEVPDFKDIFIDFYNSAIDKINDDDISAARKFVEDQLIIEGRRISLDEIMCKRYIKDETLKTLVESRLLRAERNSMEGISYELSHDTLVPPIKEIADKRREKEAREQREKEENERLQELMEERKRQRKIIAIVSIAAILSITFGIFGFWQKSIAQKNEEKAKNLLKDLKKEQFDKNINKAHDLQQKAQYKQAKEAYKQALEFINNPAINDSIQHCETLLSYQVDFENYIQQADSLFLNKHYLQAISSYAKAQKTGYKDIKNIIEEKKKNALFILEKDLRDYKNLNLSNLISETTNKIDSIHLIKY